MKMVRLLFKRVLVIVLVISVTMSLNISDVFADEELITTSDTDIKTDNTDKSFATTSLDDNSNNSNNQKDSQSNDSENEDNENKDNINKDQQEQDSNNEDNKNQDDSKDNDNKENNDEENKDIDNDDDNQNQDISEENVLKIVLKDGEYEINSKAEPLDGTFIKSTGETNDIDNSNEEEKMNVTYCWYILDEDEFKVIEGATESTYVPDTSKLGEYKYKVIATIIDDSITDDNIKDNDVENVNEQDNDTNDNVNKENETKDNSEQDVNKQVIESNVACIKVVEKLNDKKDELDSKPGDNNPNEVDKEGFQGDKNPENMPNGKPGIGNQPPGEGFGKDRMPGLSDRIPGILDRNLPGMGNKPNGKGGFPGQKPSNLKKTSQTESSSSTSTSTTEEEDTSYKEVEIDDKEVTTEVKVKYGEGIINIAVKDEDVEESVKLKLSSIENVIGACLSDSDLKKAYNGATIKIKVIAQYINGEVPEDDEDLIKEGTKALNSQVNGLTIGDYLDISVSKKVGDNDWKKLTDLSKRLKIVITLPNDIKQKEGEKYIIRLHDGEYVLVKDMDDDNTTFTFSTKYFSTYALAYVSDVTETKSSEKISKSSSYVGWIVGGVGCVIAAVLLIIILKNKREKTY